MGWWVVGVVPAIGVVGLLAALSRPLPALARLRREFGGWRRELTAATPALRAAAQRVRARGAGGTGGGGA